MTCAETAQPAPKFRVPLQSSATHFEVPRLASTLRGLPQRSAAYFGSATCAKAPRPTRTHACGSRFRSSPVHATPLLPQPTRTRHTPPDVSRETSGIDPCDCARRASPPGNLRLRPAHRPRSPSHRPAASQERTPSHAPNAPSSFRASSAPFEPPSTSSHAARPFTSPLPPSRSNAYHLARRAPFATPLAGACAACFSAFRTPPVSPLPCVTLAFHPSARRAVPCRPLAEKSYLNLSI